jgi:hypothetical protein
MEISNMRESDDLEAYPLPQPIPYNAFSPLLWSLTPPPPPPLPPSPNSTPPVALSDLDDEMENVHNKRQKMTEEERLTIW